MREEREPRRARAAPWRERGGSERKHEEERVDSTMKKGRFQGGQARRASLGEVESGECTEKLSMKTCSLDFTPSQAKPEMGKEVGRRRARS